MDVRSDEEGRPCFIEANPLAGLRPQVSDLAILAGLRDIPYDDLICAIVDSARERLGLQRR